MAGSSTADGPFFFDLGDPRAYVEAERLIATDPSREWIPARSDVVLRCAHEGDAMREDVQRAVARLELQPLRWPDPFPFDSTLAMHVATYAKQIGRIVAFALAAYRQAFAGGRSLEDPDTVLIAAAACEMHPAAVRKAAGLRSVRDALAEATALAAERGVRDVPALWTGERVFHGDADLPRAARALAAA
jgi:2-hydroxychromene-2-carboxylate isomerase